MNYVTNVYILPPGSAIPTGKPCAGCGGHTDAAGVVAPLVPFPPACDPDLVQKLICDHGVWKLVAN